VRRIVQLAVLLSAAPAAAEEVTGEVVSATGRWSADGAVIVTDAVIRDDDGAEVTVVQLGGRADGLAQKSWPSTPRLEPGARVTVRAHAARDLTARAALVVDDVLVRSPGRAPFVRTGPTEEGNSLRWDSGCVLLTYDEQGTEDLAGDVELDVLDAVLATWRSYTQDCSYLTLSSIGRIDGEVRYDAVNLVLFRDDLWCRPAHGDVPEMCLPSSAAGLTTVTYIDDPASSRDGEIVDTDVEINGQDFAIATEGSSQGILSCHSDLANTFTHELGHVMGFDHTCLTPADDPKVDGDGDPVPLCSDTDDPEIVEATMYNFQDCGETKKESLSQDDIDALCAVYPTAQDPGTCEHVGETIGCCSAAPGSGLPLGTLLGAAGIGALVLRRRRRG
jgi:MYXO-CTERM domain-containing protein